MKSKQLKSFAQVAVLILIIILISRWLLPVINSKEFEEFIIRIGPFGPFVIIFITLIGHVFLPFAGSPVLLLSFTIYGAIQTSLYLYIASIFGAIINFEIARQYGRKIVKKLVGQKTIDEIDIFSRFSGEKTLTLARLFAFPFFEVISYAAGLTNISFRNYMIITALVGAIPNLTMAFLFRNADLSNPINFYIWLSGLLLLSFGFSLAMKQYHDKYLKNNDL